MEAVDFIGLFAIWFVISAALLLWEFRGKQWVTRAKALMQGRENAMGDIDELRKDMHVGKQKYVNLDNEASMMHEMLARVEMISASMEKRAPSKDRVFLKTDTNAWTRDQWKLSASGLSSASWSSMGMWRSFLRVVTTS